MDIDKISKSIFEKKSSDYVFIIFFLLIFSVFIIFAIKPSLTTAYSLKKEQMDLTKVDLVYEEVIADISSIQSQIEDTRDSLPLLNESVTQQPKINKIIEDVKKIADKNSLTINKANVININFSKTNTEKQDVQLKMEVTSSFENLKKFIDDMFLQRRLKLVNDLIIDKDVVSSQSGILKIVLVIDGYYL